MRNESHKTLIGILREHVADWRRTVGLSSASAIDIIVAAHAHVGGPAVTGIRFDSLPNACLIAFVSILSL